MNRHDHAELDAIVRALLERTATDDQQHRLAALLRVPEARRLYLAHMNAQALLEWRFGQGATGGSFTAAPPPRRQITAGTRRSRVLMRWATAAAIVLSFTTILSLLVTRAWNHRDHAGAIAVATLVDAEAAAWEGGESIPVGTPLTGRMLELRSGWAEVETSRGARVRLEGPCELALNSPMHSRLVRGRIVTHVPPTAHGFTVAGPGLAVVDLGTAFKMSVSDKGATGVRVLVGRVRVELGNKAAPVELTADHALRLAAPGATPVITAIAGAGGVKPITVRLSGPIDLADPRVEVPGVTGPRAKLFREQQGVTLTRSIMASLTEPGRCGHFKQQIPIGKGRRVSSFLIHLAPGTQAIATYDVAVTFNRSVLGVIAANGLLSQSDAVLGRLDVPYPQGDRGLEGASEPRWADVMELSPDRRTVRMRLRSSGGVDEVRVVVDAGEAGGAER